MESLRVSGVLSSEVISSSFLSDRCRLQEVVRDLLGDDADDDRDVVIGADDVGDEVFRDALQQKILIECARACDIDVSRSEAVRQARDWEKEHSGKPKAFGVSSKELAQEQLNQQPLLGRVQIEAIQTWLQRLLEEVKAFFGIQPDENLSDAIQELLRKRTRLETYLSQARSRKQARLGTCEKMLKRQITILRELLIEHKLKKQVEMDEATVDVMCLRVKALCKKLEVIKNNLRRQTYTPESVKALGCIREGLKREIQVEQSSYDDTVRQLQAYEGIDEFDEIVNEYVQTNKKIKLQQELLQQINDTM